MDVDKLFKLPKLPSSSLNKRKWAEPTAESLKASKVDYQDSPSTSTSTSKRPPSASVGDEDDEMEQHDEFAPGNDADYFIEDDDEGGRFYGGGLTDTQKRILEVMNRDGEEGEDKRPEQNLAGIKKQLLKFERSINKNQEMRVKFSDDPKKFIQSESDLHSSLKDLLVLTTNPSLYYPELVKNGTTTSLCGLLSHENADISGTVIEVLEELTDEDVLDNGEEVAEGEDEEGEVRRKGQEGMKVLVDSLLENQLLELLVQNLSRFNDQLPTSTYSEPPTAAQLSDLESDSQSIYHLLGVIENLVTFRSELTTSVLEIKEILPWLLGRIERKESSIAGGGFNQNKAYSAEILAILCQKKEGKMGERNCELVGKGGGVGRVLGVLAQYRKKPPSSSEELEFMENLFDILCSLLSLPSNKNLFSSEEGLELMLILLKSSTSPTVQLRSVKVLDHALSTSSKLSIINSEKFVQELGLKPLFKLLMDDRKGKGKKDKISGENLRTREDEEHILGILNSLLNNLESDSQLRVRLLGKFVEKEYEKVDRLLEMREENLGRIKGVEREIEREKQEILDDGDEILPEEEELFYLRRLDSGLFSLQLIDYILAWICMEDDGIMSHAKMLLERKAAKGQGAFDKIIEVLKEYYANMGDELESKEEESIKPKEIIVELVNYLLAL